MVRKRWLKQLLTAVLILSLAVLAAACAQAGDQNMQTKPFQALDADVSLSVINKDGGAYVSLDQLIEILELNVAKNAGSYKIGDYDIAYEVTANADLAKKDDTAVKLARKPYTAENGDMMIPLEAVEVLFEEAMNYTVQGNQIVIHPNPFLPIISDVDVPDFFADDPEDPAAKETSREEDVLDIGEQAAGDHIIDENHMQRFRHSPPGHEFSALALKDINIDAMIKTGGKYLGVPYEFGADKYHKSKRFDCSSFTQQLYGTYGVHLPRVARNQAKKGIYVSRKNLRRGDLLFFSVPGRFKSNKTVGHVGIYLGNGRMLHSSPAPKDGVQVTNINKEYWKDTYLGAKRVVK